MALRLITSPYFNTILGHPAVPFTINPFIQDITSIHKKPLISFSLSYSCVEREKEINDAPLPLRRPMIKHWFKGHDSPRGAIRYCRFLQYRVADRTFFMLTMTGQRVGVVGEDQTSFIWGSAPGLAWPLSCATFCFDGRPELDFYFVGVVWLGPEVVLWKTLKSK